MALVDNIWPDVISLPRDIWFRRIKSYFIYGKKRKEFKGQSRFFKVKVCQSLLGCYNNIFHNNISQLMIWLLWFNTTFLLINYYTTCCDNTYQKTFERQTKKSHRKFSFLYNSNYITEKLNFTSISFFSFFGLTKQIA